MDAFDTLHPTAASWLRSSALAPSVPAYWSYLTERRYAPSTARSYLCCLAHFARWIRRCRHPLDDLDHAIARFIDEHLPRCTCPSLAHRCRHQVRAALQHLRVVLGNSGIVTDRRRVDPIEEALHRYDEHMQQARGLARSTRLRRLKIVDALIRKAAAVTPSAEQLRRFIAQELDRVSPASGGVIATALRGYLHFRAFEGDRVEHLLPVIGSPARWRLAPLPQTLSRNDVERLLDAFPPGLPSRLRSYAIVRCFVDLGLRTHEVSRLALDDIDWTAGTLRIAKCKTRRTDLMPLPPATGRAIAEYLRMERPLTVNRQVFVRHVAPADEPVGPDVVRNTVRNAYRRCGLPYTRVHILRHTLASRLLDTGGTLKEVADVLRHRHLDTTLIYAKVDMNRLGAVAMPWPGSTA
ncbi:tyrosine-type recombinase/integrase [Variovorax sp. NFACC27]|jgi:integrase|uniref:Tyrosine-type recombinase/integrase n=1 Tax=Variovorax paradoxus TaxID=34073 RepID=A0A5Q0LZ66_VARPD|nr:tyrosine-type recombinase/integrase [Variovorax paradoxus]SEF19327.1 Site-specific recombinase XerD [Variovorax sp. NFACC28]SEF74010.1 Site-specific recombinase XerD [Variovorax sp. NFACC29]SFB78111.1 Site-specific recombinase XerD [Variovorax sp. NFACC26]SFG77499.1 Site-specific recombinase XerD [Variovorax sp. NFACC27]QFZ81887.1 tyrosine-type recombinase/integrase [Variovorax paradoxus]